MAGDWIPVSVDLHGKPEVARVSAALGKPIDEIVGTLIRFWIWVQAHTADGSLKGLGVAEASAASQVSARFISELEKVGWLQVAEGGLTIPQFDRWFSGAAKRRLLTRQRVAKLRVPDGRDPPDPRLLRLIDLWNGLPRDIVAKGNGANRDPPSKAVMAGWKRAVADPEIREFLDPERIITAARKALFCHGKPWFSLPWLFARNKRGEPNLSRLLAGLFDNPDGEQGNGRTNARIGGVVKHFDEVSRPIRYYGTEEAEAEDKSGVSH